MEDPDDVGALFVDRLPEAEAVRTALARHRMRMDQGLVDPQSLRNVLTFHGEGGVGKTELSRQLAAWITGDERAATHWGRRPSTAVDAVVRWDVNDSRGGLDPLPLLVALRARLGLVQRTWPAFDLAFAAFHRSLRPGVELRLQTPSGVATTMSEVVAGLVGDAVSATDVVLTGGVGAATVGIGRSVVATAHARSIARRAIRAHPPLEQLIADCEALSGSLDETATVAGRVAFMLTRQIDLMSPPDRPLIVVFVDHAERLQVPGETHLGEATLNRLVARLPYLLFVVTGRNSLGWHMPTTGLPASGARAWPLLSTVDPPHDEPRQHLVGHLSPTDAEAFLRTSFATHDIEVRDGLVEHLARITDGWPLHLQMIVGVARERSSPGRRLTAGDLGGDLSTLVDRLLRDLAPDVAEAFRAACLLPYFDIAFVAAAAELRRGAVERLVERQLVRPNPGSVYPYRIHDTLRALVRDSGAGAVGGWAEADWEHHAGLALAEAATRFDQAMDAGDDLAAIHSLALGLNVATENGGFDPWLVLGIRRSPSIQGLAPLVATHPGPDATADLVDALEFLQLRARAEREDVTAELAAVADRRTAIASSAALFRAYDLRKRGRFDEVMAQLRQLLDELGDRPRLYRNQIATSLRLHRRFADVHAMLDQLTEVQQDAHRAAIDRHHGRYDRSAEVLQARADGAMSRRFQVELLADLMLVCHRDGGVARERVAETHRTAVQIGHGDAQATCIGVLAEMAIFDEAAFADHAAELEELSGRYFQPYRAWPSALALRAWATGDDDLAARAHAIAAGAQYRTSAWISTEILLEALGHPLDPVPTQWLEPRSVVRDRWLGVWQRIVERARALT